MDGVQGGRDAIGRLLSDEADAAVGGGFCGEQDGLARDRLVVMVRGDVAAEFINGFVDEESPGSRVSREVRGSRKSGRERTWGSRCSCVT